MSAEDVRVTVENGKSHFPDNLMEYPTIFSARVSHTHTHTHIHLFRDSDFHQASLVVRSRPAFESVTKTFQTIAHSAVEISFVSSRRRRRRRVLILGEDGEDGIEAR